MTATPTEELRRRRLAVGHRLAPAARAARPEEVAAAIVVLAGRGAEWASGSVVDFNGASHLR